MSERNENENFCAEDRTSKQEEIENWGRLKRLITRDNAVDLERIARFERDANGKWMSDNESRAQRRYDRWMSHELMTQVDRRNEILSNPYFRRIDLTDNEGSSFTCYVSDRHSYLDHDASKLIFDWRDNFVNAFIAGGQSVYTVNDYTYNLMLRRRISFENGEVQRVVTDYDAEGLTVNGVVVDEFLMSLLRDKRSIPGLSTIITTIHENQNNIVRAPLSQSFAVQGCAGSGKTMVMLHRLSYLIYNHKELDVSHVKIITPGEIFADFIDGLCRTLEIETIERISPERYYAELINGMQKRSAALSGDTVYDGKPYIKANLTALRAEKNLDPELLKRLYSMDFFREICEEYKSMSEELMERLDGLGLFDLLENRNAAIKPGMLSHRLYKAIENRTDSLLSNHNNARQGIAGFFKRNKKQLLSEDEIRILEQTRTEISTFAPDGMMKWIEGKTGALYREFGSDYNPDLNYRHRLYLILLLCALYFGPDDSFVSYINIDEAQDFSPAELYAVKMAEGDNTVFNIYGDLNQAVFDYRRIEDWDEISDIAGSLFSLNENYRNTIQITEYCGTELGINTTSIGFDGEKVVRDTADKVLNSIRTMHNYNPELRLAVIYKNGREPDRKKLNDLFDADTDSSAVSAGKIFVLSVENAKGLEFDGAVVFDRDMTPNEKYVAYTRALDNLFIVNE